MENKNLVSFSDNENLSQLRLLTHHLFITREEIAQILGVSISSVDRGLKANNPPFNKAVRIGRRVLFPSSCLNEFLLKEEVLKNG